MNVLEELIDEIKLNGIKDVAKKAGISVYTVYNWLSGKATPLLTTAEVIADAMGYELVIVPKGKYGK